ncbi:MAG: HypC/HybG/HupF family hydrogenase formation chaperone [Thermoanaerobaculia bacterium]
MCLGVPGQVVRVDKNDLGMTMGVVKFGGISKEVCLMYTPEAEIGDWVLVHVGFAISKLDEEQAKEVFATLQEMGDLADLTDVPDAKG